MSSTEFELLAIARWQQTKENAEKRGLSFTLTVSQVKTLLLTKRCYYSGKLLVDGPHPKGGALNPCRRTFERLDNSKGYTAKNVRAVCMRLNNIRSDASLEELEQIAEGIRKAQ